MRIVLDTLHQNYGWWFNFTGQGWWNSLVTFGRSNMVLSGHCLFWTWLSWLSMSPIFNYQNTINNVAVYCVRIVLRLAGTTCETFICFICMLCFMLWWIYSIRYCQQVRVTVHWIVPFLCCCRCYNCGDFGNHMAAKCPHGPLPKRCHSCKSTDHLIADCPEKDNSRRSGSNGSRSGDHGNDSNGNEGFSGMGQGLVWPQGL